MSVWSREKRESQSIEESHREAIASADRVLLLAHRVIQAVEELKQCQKSPPHPKT